MKMIESPGTKLPGTVGVGVGASNIVGNPVAVLLMKAEATVISTNIHTRNLPEICRTADVLITAVGKPNLITTEMIRSAEKQSPSRTNFPGTGAAAAAGPGAGVVAADAGISRTKDQDGLARTA